MQSIYSIYGRGTYVAIYGKSPSKHDRGVALSGGLEGQDQAELTPGSPEHGL
jgi:hypothetical protein